MKIYDVTLNNGVKMPVLGLGVYKTTDTAEMKNAVLSALETDYRSFDTAQMYGNEDILGEALYSSTIPRKDLFITTKISTSNMSRDLALSSFAQSLDKLKTDYVDLVLIHWCGQNKERLLEVWGALEELYKEGKTRAIGLSNGTIKHINWILEANMTVPAVNQVEHHPLMNDASLFDFCKLHNIQLEAWGPLIRGNFDIPQIVALSEKYKKSPAQIILRWVIQGGYVTIPKSSNKNRIGQNADIFDFSLDENDMDIINSLNINHRTAADPETFDF